MRPPARGLKPDSVLYSFNGDPLFLERGSGVTVQSLMLFIAFCVLVVFKRCASTRVRTFAFLTASDSGRLWPLVCMKAVIYSGDCEGGSSFSIETLRKPTLALTLGFLLIATILFWGGIAFYVSNFSISVSKIGAASLVTEEEAKELQAASKPISDIALWSASEGKTVFSGYAADVKDVCKTEKFPIGEVVLLTQFGRGEGFAAVSTTLDSQNCKVFLKQTGSRPMWVVSMIAGV